jgi:hypothetical protein
MSGTSLDRNRFGTDCFTVRDKQWKFEIQIRKLFHINPLVKQIKTALTLSNEDLAQLNQDYTIHLATVINNFIAKNSY